MSQWEASVRMAGAGARPRLRRTDRLVLGSFDTAAHALQQRARVILLGAGALMLPMMALNLLLSVLAFNSFDSLDSLFADRGYVGVDSSTVLLAIVVQSFTAHLIGAYAATFLVGHQLGNEPTMGQCLWATFRRFPMLLVTWLLTHWWAVLLALFAVNAPSVFGGLSIFIGPVVALATVSVLVVVPVMMTEHSGLRSIPRALRLVRTRFGAAYGFVLMCAIIAGSLFFFIAQLPYLLEKTGFVTFGSAGYLVQGVTLQLALLVVLPLCALATAQLYLQLRVHAEGIDISMAADRAFGPRA